jgi:hypothetical protein
VTNLQDDADSSERHALQILAGGEVEPDALDSLLRLYHDAWSDFPSDGRQTLTTTLAENAVQISYGELAERWMLLVALVYQARGIAAARDRKRIESSDVEAVQATLCDYFPRCAAMRVEGASAALTALTGRGEPSGPASA